MHKMPVPRRATGRAPKRSSRRPPKNWAMHCPKAPGSMISPLIVAVNPRSSWIYSGIITVIELNAKKLRAATIVPTQKLRFFSTLRSSRGRS